MDARQQRKLRRIQREQGTFAPAWRDLNRRQNLVSWLFIFWSLVQGIFVYPHSTTIGVLVLAGVCAAFLAFIMRRPLMTLLLVIGIGYKPFIDNLSKPLTPENKIWFVWTICTLISIAAAESYLLLFRCPNCKQRFCSFHFKASGDSGTCGHCGIMRGSLYALDKEQKQQTQHALSESL